MESVLYCSSVCHPVLLLLSVFGLMMPVASITAAAAAAAHQHRLSNQVQLYEQSCTCKLKAACCNEELYIWMLRIINDIIV
jgi:hypothetical protein